MTKLFGSSTKVRKGELLGWRTFISYLTPGGKLCPWASDGCRAMCLGTNSGHFMAPLGAARRAQATRTERLAELLAAGTAAEAYVADLPQSPRGGWSKVAIRVNGTSDLPGLAESVAKLASERGIAATFYDYTKSIRAAQAWAAGTSRVHKTFSLSETNWDQARRALAMGVNVAAVIASVELAEPLASELGASAAISGDDHDLRFLDPDMRGVGRGVLVYLLPKGRASRDTSGFVVRKLGV